MPHQTYINLSPERQQEILEVAYKEFISNDYQSASLSRIINNLQLAKGSFYRYFSSKKELYFYLLDRSTQHRFDTLEKRVQEPGMDLFRLLLVNWQDKIEFERGNPLESAFQYRVFRERFNKELGDIEIQLKREIMDKTRQIIRSYFPGSIRPDIDPDLVSYFIIQIQFGMYDYLAIKFGDDLLENILKGKPLYSLHKADFEELIANFTRLLQHGISSINYQK